MWLIQTTVLTFASHSLLPPSQTLKEALVMNFLSHVNINTAWLKKNIGQTLRDGNVLLIVQPPNSA